jgi:hypothetical protein
LFEHPALSQDTSDPVAWLNAVYIPPLSVFLYTEKTKKKGEEFYRNKFKYNDSLRVVYTHLRTYAPMPTHPNTLTRTHKHAHAQFKLYIFVIRHAYIPK